MVSGTFYLVCFALVLLLYRHLLILQTIYCKVVYISECILCIEWIVYPMGQNKTETVSFQILCVSVFHLCHSSALAMTTRSNHTKSKSMWLAIGSEPSNWCFIIARVITNGDIYIYILYIPVYIHIYSFLQLRCYYFVSSCERSFTMYS